MEDEKAKFPIRYPPSRSPGREGEHDQLRKKGGKLQSGHFVIMLRVGVNLHVIKKSKKTFRLQFPLRMVEKGGNRVCASFLRSLKRTAKRES